MWQEGGTAGASHDFQQNSGSGRGWSGAEGPSFEGRLSVGLATEMRKYPPLGANTVRAFSVLADFRLDTLVVGGGGRAGSGETLKTPQPTGVLRAS